MLHKQPANISGSSSFPHFLRRLTTNSVISFWHNFLKCNLASSLLICLAWVVRKWLDSSVESEKTGRFVSCILLHHLHCYLPRALHPFLRAEEGKGKILKTWCLDQHVAFSIFVPQYFFAVNQSFSCNRHRALYRCAVGSVTWGAYS